MVDRGFDIDDRVAGHETADLERRLAPADRVAKRSYFAPPPGGDLPVLGSDESLVFASNDYLGLAGDERVQEAARRAAATVGTGAGASRLATGDTMVHHDLERLLAETKGTDRALAFSSGYVANLGTIAALDPDVIFSDEYNHASVVDGCRLSGAEVVTYDHCSVPDLREKVAARADETPARADGGGESWLVVSASAFAANGAVAPLSGICDVAEEVGAWVAVDEAHATGLYARGGGVVQAEGVSERVHVQTGTLSNALASQGGYVAGSDALIEYLVGEVRPFVFSTGLAPPAAAAASEALHVARHGDARERLWEAVAHLRDGLESMGYDVLGDSQILPVFVGDRRDARDLVAGLRDRGVVARTVRPPTVPEGTSRVRATPMATHDSGDVVACLEAFQAAGEDVGLL